MQTNGVKPTPFQLNDNIGEYYYFASKVGKYLGMFGGSLFERYPSLRRRLVTNEERKKLVSLGLIPSSLTKYITVLKASEVNEIFAGRDKKFKKKVDAPEQMDGECKALSYDQLGTPEQLKEELFHEQLDAECRDQFGFTEEELCMEREYAECRDQFGFTEEELCMEREEAEYRDAQLYALYNGY
uniref:SWI/SNF Subunit INI1 DNA binding domain-containing protein n=1 Tax=Tetranychus urticae TaxID=32264 RepID=T1KTW1_TETUR